MVTALPDGSGTRAARARQVERCAQAKTARGSAALP